MLLEAHVLTLNLNQLLVHHNHSRSHAGKVIVKHEDHVLWIESLVLRNLGPVSRFYNGYVRRKIGQAFSIIGNTIYTTLKTGSDLVSLLTTPSSTE